VGANIYIDTSGGPPFGWVSFANNHQNVIAPLKLCAYYLYMPKLRHYDNLNTARFVTFCCYHRFELLVHQPVIEVFLDELDKLRNRQGIRIFGYVIMPEHVHLVLHPPDGLKLGPVIGALKSKTASRVIAERLIELPDACQIIKDGRQRRIFWQPRCYDHNCRSRETVIEKIVYCHNNPVKRGLVNEPSQWRWSSYSCLTGKTDVALRTDELDEVVVVTG